MTNDAQDKIMLQVPQAKLAAAYDIVDAMRQVMDGEVQAAMGTCYMTDGYETLAAACGLLGEILGLDGMRKRTIQEEPTRTALRECYRAADQVLRNALPGTDAMDVAASLRACALSGLNETYGAGQTAEESVGRVLYMSGYGLEILGRCAELGPEPFREMYRDPDGDTLHGHAEALEKALRMLQPRYDPGKDGQRKEDGAS